MIKSLAVISLGLLVACGADDSPPADAQLEMFTVAVVKTGNGGGSVTSAPTGIDCGAACSASVTRGAQVTLTAIAASGSSFIGWMGACSGTGPCAVSADADMFVVAAFALDDTLMVATLGTGTGTVTSSLAGISCGSDCDEVYPHGTVVTLTATPESGSRFAGWTSGGCTGTGTCTVTLDTATLVAATFMPDTFALTVGRNGNGTGTITSESSGISCGVDCTEDYAYGTSVTLTATPATGSVFTGWTGGGCSGTGDCTTTIGDATFVVATFTLTKHALTVTRDGAGIGTVTSSPAGIDCGSDCTEDFDYGTTVTLTATPDADSTFTGWSGAGCSGIGTCTTTVTAAAAVTATFNPAEVTITVQKAGTLASGATVSSTPAAIDCGATCTATVPYGTSVTLAQTPGGGIFESWSGAGCSGIGACTFSATSDITVTATYRPVRVAITSGTGSCLRSSGNVLENLQALLTSRGHTATIVAGTEIDTEAEIDQYDVLVPEGPGAGCAARTDYATYDAQVDAYVKLRGGGVVASGWFLYQNFNAPGLVGVLPSPISSNYTAGQTVTPVAGSPITAGLGTFTAAQFVPHGGGPLAGSTALLTAGATTIAEAWDVGAGRTAFLGPMFVEDHGSYDNESLLDGSQAASVELFLRTIEWCAKAR